MKVITLRNLQNKAGDHIKAGHPCLVLRHDPPYLNICALMPRPTKGIRVCGVTICNVEEIDVRLFSPSEEFLYKDWI